MKTMEVSFRAMIELRLKSLALKNMFKTPSCTSGTSRIFSSQLNLSRLPTSIGEMQIPVKQEDASQKVVGLNHGASKGFSHKLFVNVHLSYHLVAEF